MSTANAIRRHRDAKGISQEEVAEWLGVTTGAVSQWETGRTTPARSRAVKLDRLLEAGGEILTELGYAVPALNQPDEVAELRSLVVELAARVEALQAQIEVLGGAAVRASRRSARGERPSTAESP